tara:strand:- start:4 stop:345 length:342 start_codon:yes stop_codon:yes gene_type:complete
VRVVPVSKKATLMKKASDLDIPTYGNPTVAELQFRLDNWKSGKGWLFRRLTQKHHPLLDGLDPLKAYYIPNCDKAKSIIETKSVVVLRRVYEPPEGCEIIGVEDSGSDLDTDS